MELEFDWDEGNIGHIARHEVIPEEVEQSILNDPLGLGAETVDGEERFSVSVSRIGGDCW